MELQRLVSPSETKEKLMQNPVLLSAMLTWHRSSLLPYILQLAVTYIISRKRKETKPSSWKDTNSWWMLQPRSAGSKGWEPHCKKTQRFKQKHFWNTRTDYNNENGPGLSHLQHAFPKMFWGAVFSFPINGFNNLRVSATIFETNMHEMSSNGKDLRVNIKTKLQLMLNTKCCSKKSIKNILQSNIHRLKMLFKSKAH